MFCSSFPRPFYLFFLIKQKQQNTQAPFSRAAYFPAVQMVHLRHVRLSQDCPILNHRPIGKTVSSQVAGRKNLHDQGWFPNLYLIANTFGLERSLGMALTWPWGLGQELPTRSPVGVQPLVTVILNEHCPVLSTAHFLAILGKSCSIQTLSLSFWEWEPPISTEVIPGAI